MVSARLTYERRPANATGLMSMTAPATSGVCAGWLRHCVWRDDALAAALVVLADRTPSSHRRHAEMAQDERAGRRVRPIQARTAERARRAEPDMEYAYDCGGLAKGATATLYLDGEQVGEGRVEAIQPMLVVRRGDHRRVQHRYGSCRVSSP
jgi:hypothetical protein